MSQIRVLLAEDESETRALLTQVLISFGHDVVAGVATGREAIARAAELMPDVVMLDVHMPDGSGIEAAEEITRNAPGTAVILFTGDPAVTLTDAEMASTSIIAFLPKPTPPHHVDSALRAAVKQARALHLARADATEARQALADRKIIERAKGILMRRTGSSEAVAYNVLRRSSQDAAEPMVETAKQVIASEPGYGPKKPLP